MSKREYSIREKEIVNKINSLNNRLEDRNIKVCYSVYNYNGIASKLEKTELYGADVSNAIFTRVHTCRAKYMVDEVVSSQNLKNNIELEENFNIKVSDIEKANLEDLVSFFGNMDNHETIGFGQNKEYKIVYKGTDVDGQNVEIKAWYGNKAKYKIRKSSIKIVNDGSIETTFSENVVNWDSEKGEDVLVEGIESKNPESYCLIENETDLEGNKKYKINCVGKENVNYQLVAKDKNFKKIDVVNYTGKTSNYYEYKGKIEKASGKLACRIDVANGTLVKPNFESAKTIVDANKVCDNYYKTYKNYPKVKIDEKKNKIIIQGKNTELYKMNLDKVEESVKANFEYYLNKGFSIETINCKPSKKLVRGFRKSI